MWEVIEEPTTWERWDAWLGRIEAAPVGADGRDQYDTTLVMGSTDIPAHHKLIEFVPGRRLAWEVLLPEGSAFTNVRESVDLAPRDGGSEVTYHLSYELPTLTARALHAILFGRGLEKMAETSLLALESVARERDDE